MEKRKLGNTGLESTLLGFGGFHLLEIPSDDAAKLLNNYLDAGGNYIETAASYGNHESEMKIGRAISHRRDDYILVTKSGDRDAKGLTVSLNKSLECLRTDHVDVLLMHGVGTMEELDTLLSPEGGLAAAQKAKSEGKVGHIGLSMHGQPDVLIKALESYPFELVMSTINYYDKFNFPKIFDVLLPMAKERGVGVILMKPLADGLLWESVEQGFRFAMSQDVSVVVTGMNTQEMLDKDMEIAENFVPMTEQEMDDLYKTAPELGSYVCRQCSKCMPCPEGINIPEIFKAEGYFDRQMRDGVVRDSASFALRDRLRFWFGNKQLGIDLYNEQNKKADACTECNICSGKCPYNIDIPRKLKIADYKLTGKNFY